MNKLKAVAAGAAIAAAAGVLVAGPATAAKPAPPGPFTGACQMATMRAQAYDPPKGTAQVYFRFWDTAQQYLSNDSYGNVDGGTDFNGRDGWTMFTDKPTPEVVEIFAETRKGATIASIVVYCT